MSNLLPLRPRSALRHFLQGEAAGGILLMAAAALAMIVANSGWSAAYFHALHLSVGPLSLLHWINDGLMTLFFLLVGLEIKREFVDGHLARWSDRALPMVAAAGGMAVPALVYLSIAGGEPGLARGWAIPAATDIAFAIGVMALLGPRVPASLKLFLTTVAIVDDMGAVAIIALAYTGEMNGLALLAAGAVMGAMFALNRLGVMRLWPYLALAFLLWLAVLLSGIHATIAGVLAASLIPLRPTPGAPDDAASPLHRLEHGLHPWVAYAIVPLFGFANAGVSFAGLGMEQLLAPLPLGVTAGLFLGKQAGVLAALWGGGQAGDRREARRRVMDADLRHVPVVRDRLHDEPVHRRTGVRRPAAGGRGEDRRAGRIGAVRAGGVWGAARGGGKAVIARSGATRQSTATPVTLGCFASLAMAVSDRRYASQPPPSARNSCT